MSLHLNPLNFSAPVSHTPKHPFAQTEANDENIYNVFAEKSLKERLSVPALQHTTSQPEPFPGTCAECMTKIKDTVHRTIDAMDFDGLKPYLKVIELIEKEGEEEWVVDAPDQEVGGICVGMSLVHLKNISDEHGIKGSLAIEKDESQEFHHAAVIVECQDGLVFIDNRAAPEMRLFSIPFNSTFEGTFGGADFSIVVSSKGAVPPLVLNNPRGRLEYYTDIANGVDVVNKEFMSFAITSFIPIAVYKKEDGSKLKDIIIKPNEKSVRLMNHTTKERRDLSFETIRQGGLLEELETFMGSDFHTTVQDAHDEIVKFVAHVDKMIELFS